MAPAGLFRMQAARTWPSDWHAGFVPALPFHVGSRLIVGLWLLGLLSAVEAQTHPPITTPVLEVAVSTGGASVRATGSWITRIKRGPSLSIAPVNAVEIHCSRASMTCWESRAELVSGEARPRVVTDTPREQLAVTTLNFTVTEWTDTRITARSDTRNGDLMLRVVPSENLVRLSYWDTQGNQPKGEASGFVWELQ